MPGKIKAEKKKTKLFAFLRTITYVHINLGELCILVTNIIHTKDLFILNKFRDKEIPITRHIFSLIMQVNNTLVPIIQREDNTHHYTHDHFSVTTVSCINDVILHH